MATAIELEWPEIIARRFGAIPPWRVRSDPQPGTATERDVLRIHASEKRLCELVDGILVEKAMGYEESLVAMQISHRLLSFLSRRKLGIVAGEAGMLKLARGLVRIPDVSYVSYDRLPGRRAPRQPIPRLAPNLAVEVLSQSNTRREMEEKLVEYFDAGVEVVWLVDVQKRTVEVFSSPNESAVFKIGQTVSGGTVLPGFRLKVRDLFGQLDQQ